MVQEFRRIMLDEQELISALECYRRMTPHSIPEGIITQCTPIEEPEGIRVEVNIEVPGATALQRITHTLKEVAVLKPLIRFCLENNIMLPKDGLKSASVVGGFVCLCIALNLDFDVSEHVKPLRIDNVRFLSPGDILSKKASSE